VSRWSGELLTSILIIVFELEGDQPTQEQRTGGSYPWNPFRVLSSKVQNTTVMSTSAATASRVNQGSIHPTEMMVPPNTFTAIESGCRVARKSEG
jgi:hypothetical protein